jgi:hypothetical protein
MLREMGYEAIYVNPLHKNFVARTDVKEIVNKFAKAVEEAVGIAEAKLASLAVTAVR